jgi:uncharacterized membrane protein YhfC
VVSNISIVCMIFTALFTIFMPIVVAIVFYKKTKFKWRFFFAGAIVFTVMQIVIRIPILQSVLPICNGIRI